MLPVILAHLVVGLILVAVGRRWGRDAFALAALAPAATAVWGVTKVSGALEGAAPTATLRWVPTLDLELGWRLDAFALVMVLVVGVVAALVLVYARSYFDHAAGRQGHRPARPRCRPRGDPVGCQHAGDG